jgi:hypothetical protein
MTGTTPAMLAVLSACPASGSKRPQDARKRVQLPAASVQVRNLIFR